MNLRYEIKRCQGFGYATTVGDCKMKQVTRNRDKQIVYIKDSKNESRIKNAINVGDSSMPFIDYYESIMDKDVHDPLFDKETVFLVEVGVKDTTIVKQDVVIDETTLMKIIDEFEINADISDENKEAYKGFTKNLFLKPKQYTNLECTESYLDYLSQLYLKIDGTSMQKTILQLLVFNQKRCDELIRKHPLNYQPVETVITRFASTFSDMKVSDPYFDKNDESFDVEQINGISRNMTVGNIAKFGSFGNSFAQVEHAKKRANIPDINVLRNHANIHILARNRIASVPRTFEELNITKLMKLLSRFNKFHIILIYPNYHQLFVYSDAPNRSMEIDADNGNVIMAVFLRYIIIYFYGMHAIVNQEDKFAKYLM